MFDTNYVQINAKHKLYNNVNVSLPVQSHINLLPIESEGPSFIFKLHLWEKALWMMIFGYRTILKENVSLFKTYRLHC